MEWIYHNPTKLVFGDGCVKKNAVLLKPFGDSCLIVAGKTSAKASGALDDMIAALDSQGIAHTLFDEIEPNPLLETSKRAGDMAREIGAGFIVGIGGGSPLDAAKAAAVYAVNDMPLMDIYKLDWANPALPMIAVGTTAGTGSEVGPASVMTTPAGRKKSLVRPDLFPRIAFGDARYTRSLSRRFTVSTALDSLAHAIEGYFSIAACEMTDILAREAVFVLVPQLRTLARDDGPIAVSQREQLYYASVLAGMTMARCGTTFCHGLGYLLTEQLDVPHGFACATMLPEAIRRGGWFEHSKAQWLYKHAGTEEAELCELIEQLCEMPKEKFSDDVLVQFCKESASLPNLARTLPHGFSEGESLALMRRLFG